MFTHKNSRGFTLLELIIVIAIIAILATILIIVINPVETLRRARDVQRLSDLATLKTAIGLVLTEDPNASLGDCRVGNSTSGTYYHTNSTSTVPTGFTDELESTSTLTDGTGWIPVNFGASASMGSAISHIPLDPANGATTYYSYACRDNPKTFEINAKLESDDFSSKMQSDGGNSSLFYEVGTRLDII